VLDDLAVGDRDPQPPGDRVAVRLDGVLEAVAGDREAAVAVVGDGATPQ
jgi:hypothetical protein